MSESEQSDKLKDDPLSFVAELEERVKLLEKQVAALMNHADRDRPPGTNHAWPRK